MRANAGETIGREVVIGAVIRAAVGMAFQSPYPSHTTEIPIGIPMGIPIPTEPEVSILLHVGLPSPIGTFLLFVR